MNLQDYKETKKRLTKSLNDLNKDGVQILQDELAAIFIAHPDLKSVGWEQYTPYFNDGDVCYFRSNGMYDSDVFLNQCNIYGEADDSENSKDALTQRNSEEFRSIAKEISSLLSTLGDSVLEQLGEGRINITFNNVVKITCEEIEHE